ncbi:alpha/beta fold hydrolase [Herbaspirillum sp. AP02]|uniref:YqiA/YcfP family alpha/beta fold hydrolase n=1 Tax=unclassified Herbaspirillum TaxID=2624150 RepID=UPI0015D96DFE|nr:MULTISPECIES: YqiA/YcfP family alpha/beta fold hydrolase [unclassified Herbaspirillum]MBG7620267.1 alpha/beta fold hydrolase [Herbaspirillum sp. AP02]NZD67731.1 alpha/beta fold hydrolase [Herbaspirillum sp. AP21]
MILYLHGFRSSPQSFKARVMGQRMAELGLQGDYLCPQLPASPAAAIALAGSLVAGIEPAQLTVVGSSLGGFYATWLAEHLGCRAVLVNPAVKPPRDLESYVGVSTQYHSDEPFEFKHEYIAELRSLVVPAISRPQRYLLLAATGDEVLDWREMVAHYPGARQIVIQGSDHGMAEFEDYLDEVLAFCGVDPAGKVLR